MSKALFRQWPLELVMGTSGYMFLEKLNANIRYLKTALDRSNLWLELYVIPHFVTFVC